MKLKPKSTVLNPRALLYKRFISIERMFSLSYAYMTYDNKYWIFDQETEQFMEIETPSSSAHVTEIANQTTLLSYGDKYFYYQTSVETLTSQWVSTTTLPQNVTLLSASFNNVAKYQTNKYYSSGSFDYMIRGNIEGTTTQFIKGNITPLTSFNIKYFNDDIDMGVDDLVVISGKLYSVENPETVQKRQPKAFNVHFATLNSIL